jgi:hypothetical protein
MSGLTATTILVFSQGEPIASISASLTNPSRGYSNCRMQDTAAPQVGKRTSFTFRPISVSRL